MLIPLALLKLVLLENRMRPTLWICSLLTLAVFAADAPKTTKPASKPLAEQPLRMEKDIQAFEAKDKANHQLLLFGQPVHKSNLAFSPAFRKPHG